MIVTHIVLVDWKDGLDPAGRAGVLVDLHLPRIPGLDRIRRGRSVSPEGLEADYEWGLVADFESTDARDAYLVHPEHAPLSEFLRANAARILVFDIEAAVPL